MGDLGDPAGHDMHVGPRCMSMLRSEEEVVDAPKRNHKVDSNHEMSCSQP